MPKRANPRQTVPKWTRGFEINFNQSNLVQEMVLYA